MKTERQRRERKAYLRGFEDRMRGVRLEDNPLRLAAGGVGEAWERGWRMADNEECQRRMERRGHRVQ